jgi:hypothetical protein
MKISGLSRLTGLLLKTSRPHSPTSAVRDKDRFTRAHFLNHISRCGKTLNPADSTSIAYFSVFIQGNSARAQGNGSDSQAI